MKLFILIYLAGVPSGVLGPVPYSEKMCNELIATDQIPECKPVDGRSCKCEWKLDVASLRQSASSN